MRRARILVVLLAIAAPALIAQQPVTIKGRVVSADNRQPLRRALVVAGRIPQNGPPGLNTLDRPSVLTDDDGRFDISLPTAGSTLTVSKGGYATTAVETTRKELTSGQEITIQLPKGAAVSGRITRRTGDALSGTRVLARRFDAKPDDSVAGVGVSNDLGEFRISGLLAGRYEISPEPLPGVILSVLAQTATGDRRPPSLNPRDLRPAARPLDPARAIDVQPGSDVGPMDLSVDESEVPPIPANVTVTRDANGAVFAVRAPCPTCDPAIGRSDVIPERPSGAIGGTVVDHAGEPFQGVRVEAMRLERRGGRMVVIENSHPGPKLTTDDRGRYRVSGLSPGVYMIVASTDAAASGLDRARGDRFTKVYYPGTPNLESAQTIRVDERQDVGGVDFTFGPSRVVRVAGTARDRAGEPLVGQVRLIASARSGALAVDPIVTRVDWDGTFEFPNVLPGDYVVQAVGTNPGRRNEFGIEYVSVGDAQPDPLAIVTSTGTTLEGRFVVEGGRQVPPMRFMNLHASPNDLDIAPAEGRGPDGLSVFDQGRFSMTGLRGSMRLTAGELPAGWYVKSISIGGLDITDRPFDFGVTEQTISGAEVLFGTTGATIAGTVSDRDPRNPAVPIVLVFARSRELWFEGSRYLKLKRGDADGGFTIDGLPAGEYWVAALDRWPVSDWQTAEALEALIPLATRISVAEGQALSTDLRLRRRVP